MAIDGCDVRQLLRCGRRYSVEDQLWLNGKLLAELAVGIDGLVLSGGGGSAALEDATLLPLVTVGFAAIAAGAGAYVVGSADTHDKRRTSVLNKTDEDIIVSWDDGTTDHEVIGPNGSVTVNWGELGLVLPTAIKIKYASSAPTTGSVYISGTY